MKYWNEINRVKMEETCNVVIVYDTSYLMEYRESYRFPPNGKYEGISPLCLIIPEEVERELTGHFSNEDKEKAAKRGRKTLARLIEMGAEVCSIADEERISVNPTLGADSEVDQRLIGFAKRLATGSEHDIVLIATNDGGIEYEVAKLRLKGLYTLNLINEHERANLIDEINAMRHQAVKAEREAEQKQKVKSGCTKFLLTVIALIAGGMVISLKILYHHE